MTSSHKSGLLKNAQRISRKALSYTTKSPNDSVVVYLPQDTKRGMKSPRSSCRLYKVLVLAFSVSICAVCVLVWLTSSIIDKRVMARLTSQLQHAHLDPAHGFSSQKGELSELKRRSVSGRRRRRRRERNRRGSGSCCQHRHSSMSSAVHLHITPGERFKTAQGDYFVWEEREDLHLTSSTFQFSRSAQHEREIKGVIIRQRGLYEAYSQAVLKGRSSNFLPYNCAQQIVRIRNGQESVLLKSYVTQHGLGMAISSDGPGGSSFWPIDSSFQYGVFLLHARDELRVSFNGCINVRFSNADSKAFYFGVAKK